MISPVKRTTRTLTDTIFNKAEPILGGNNRGGVICGCGRIYTYAQYTGGNH